MENDLEKMIPTSSRTQIPRSLSYTAGAQMISLAWQDVPQFDSFEMRFLCDVAHEMKRDTALCGVLSVWYSRRGASLFTPRNWVENGGRGPLWYVDVACCRREDAHEIREWLRETGLAQAREWLHQVAGVHGQYTSVSWGAAFDEETRLFSIKHCSQGK